MTSDRDAHWGTLPTDSLLKTTIVDRPQLFHRYNLGKLAWRLTRAPGPKERLHWVLREEAKHC